MFTFKKFEKTNARFEDRITVTKSFSFGFPTKFYEDNNINGFQYVELYYDLDQKAVGLKFTNEGDDKSKFRILRSQKKYGANIIATSFFKINKIDPKIYHGRYAWEKVLEPGVGELYVIRLKEREN